MIPKWVQPIQKELGDDIDFIINCAPGIDDSLRKECFEVYKKAVVLAGFTSKENAGVFVCRRFEMFHDYLHKSWVKRDSDPDDSEFRDLINDYGMNQRVVNEETASRKKEVDDQEKEIMSRIRSDIEKSEVV